MGDSYTQRFSEIHEIAAGVTGILYPDSRAAGNHNTAYLSMQNHQRAVFIVLVGEMQAGATLDAQVWEATDAAGAGPAQLIAGKAITQLTQAGGDGDDAVIVEVRTEEMDVDNQFDFLQLRVVVAVDAVECAVFPLRFCANYPPVPVTAWQEVVD